MTTDQIRLIAQAKFNDYNDNEISKGELFRELHYPMSLCAKRYVETKDKSFIDLSGDILGLIQDIAHI